MEIKLSLSASGKAEKSVEYVMKLSESLNRYFSGRKYGIGVERLTIGLVVFEPEFASYFKPRRLRYIDSPKTIKLDGLSITIQKTIEYEHRIDYESFVNAPDTYKLLAREVLKSLSVLSSLPKKLKDFDFFRFELDMRAYLGQEGLL